MGWKDHLKRLKQEIDQVINDPDKQQQPQQQSHGDHAYPPPPAPPNQAPMQPELYWQPRFQADVPVTVEWDAKLGNADGWGNQELEHYTADPANAFQ